MRELQVALYAVGATLALPSHVLPVQSETLEALSLPYLAGLDIGQIIDHTALVLIDQSTDKRPMYTCIWAYRWPLNLSNQLMISDVKRVLMAAPDNVNLNVDYTGKGQVFTEFMERAFQEPPRTRNITTDYSIFSRAMKENLVTNTKLLLGENRLKFIRGTGLHAEMIDELFDELCNYQVRITETVRGRPSAELGALGYKQHDDLATALFLALEDAEFQPQSSELYWIRRS